MSELAQQHYQSDKSSLTITVPCCNEEEPLPLLFKRLDQLVASDDRGIAYTILFIDDRSVTASRRKSSNTWHPARGSTTSSCRGTSAKRTPCSRASSMCAHHRCRFARPARADSANGRPLAARVRGRVRAPVFECGRVLVRTPYELRIQQTFTGIVIL